MPLFNEASRIYHPDEVNFMRSCFAESALILEANDLNYSASELSSIVIMLYMSGLRDVSYIANISSRLAHQEFIKRHPELSDSKSRPDQTDTLDKL